MPQDAEFKGMAALVTGAGSGIGRATALLLASKGAIVWTTDANEAAARETAELIAGAGHASQVASLDVRHEAQWTDVFARLDAAGVPLTTLVNCAGKSQVADTFTMAVDDLRLLLAINVEGVFLGMKHGIPRIAAAGGGAVVNISSIMGLKGWPRMAGYCASKGASRMMTKAIALECADLKNKVRVNSVHPGVVDTPAWQKHSTDEAGMLTKGASLDVDEVARELVPIGVAASAEEIAQTVCFLASDAARHITGAEIVIDGGMTAG